VDHKLLLHCHIYIQHVLVLYFLVLPISVARILLPHSVPSVAYHLLSAVVHLLPSPRDLFAVSVFPCYLKEMRCDWSYRLISNDYPHGIHSLFCRTATKLELSRFERFCLCRYIVNAQSPIKYTIFNTNTWIYIYIYIYI
jgi:hypothetical protein